MYDSGSVASCETQDQGFTETSLESNSTVYRYRCSNCVRLMDFEGQIYNKPILRTKWNVNYPLRFCCKVCNDWGLYRLQITKRKPARYCKCYTYTVSMDSRYKCGLKELYDEVFIQEIQPTLGELFAPFEINIDARSRSPRRREGAPVPSLNINN